MPLADDTSVESLRALLARARNSGVCALDVGGLIADYVAVFACIYDTLSPQERDAAAKALARAPTYVRAAKFARRRLVALLNLRGSESCNYLLALALVLRADPLAITGATKEIVLIIWLFRHTEPGVVAAYLELLVTAALQDVWPASESQFVDEALLSYIVTSAGETSNGDELREAAVRALMALHSHFLYEGSNRAFSALKQHPLRVPRVTAAVVWVLNREGEPRRRQAAAELCKALLADPATSDAFYVNDLRVLVDVLARELDDLPRSAVNTQKLYLATLRLAAAQPALAMERYGAARIVSVLRATRAATEDDDIKALAASFKSLVWLDIPDELVSSASNSRTTFGLHNDDQGTEGGDVRKSTFSDSSVNNAVNGDSDASKNYIGSDEHNSELESGSDSGSESGSDSESHHHLSQDPFQAGGPFGSSVPLEIELERHTQSLPSLPNQLHGEVLRPSSTPPIPAQRARPRPPPPAPRIRSSVILQTRRPPPPPPRVGSSTASIHSTGTI